jgi:hypothetical protein
VGARCCAETGRCSCRTTQAGNGVKDPSRRLPGLLEPPSAARDWPGTRIHEDEEEARKCNSSLADSFRSFEVFVPACALTVTQGMSWSEKNAT